MRLAGTALNGRCVEWQKYFYKKFYLETYIALLYNPEFDTKNNKKVSEALILLACGTFPNFAVTRYFSCLLVSAQIFFIFLTGTISLDVQKPNAS